LAAAGAVTVTFAGGVVMLGGTAPEPTVSVAFALVTLPTALVTTTLNSAPLSLTAVGLSTYDALVAPEMGDPLRHH
jgi:hypothetical protein